MGFFLCLKLKKKKKKTKKKNNFNNKKTLAIINTLQNLVPKYM